MPTVEIPQPRAITAVMRGVAIAHSEPKAMNRMMPAAMMPMPSPALPPPLL